MHDVNWLIQELSTAGLTASRCPKTGDPITQHQLGKHTVEIRTKLPKEFPHKLPQYHLVDRERYGALAHVSWSVDSDAEICFGSSEAFHLNVDEPEKIVIHGLEKVLNELSKVLNDPSYNDSELKREFVAIWKRHVSQKDLSILCLAEPSSEILELQIRAPTSRNQSGLKRQIIAVCPKTSACNPQHFIKKESENTQRHNEGKGVLIPLLELIAPPSPGENIKIWWAKLLKSQPDQLKTQLAEYARHTKTSNLYIVCRAPTKTGHVWFSIHCEAASKQKIPLTEKLLDNWDLKALTVNAITKENLLPRSGANQELNDKHVCIVGCGSVGGYVADMLASSGIGKFTLIDPDLLMLENIHRHYLDVHWLYHSKVSALKFSLQHKYPFVEIKDENSRLLEFKFADSVEDIDLLIFATGNATQERVSNEVIRFTDTLKPAIYTWVEAYGAGGHAVAVMPEKKGCLGCVYIDKESGEPCLYPNINFIEKNQNVITSHAGCGADYISYSNIDAIQTAAITSKLAIRTLTKETKESVSVSWKGSDNLAKHHGVELSHRFHRSKNVLNEIPIAHGECSVCA